MKVISSPLVALQKFLETHCQHRMRCLLGLSGGPDSMALFFLMKEVGYPFVAAHVNHSWRKESIDEASFLEQLCQKERIPFFCKTLKPPSVHKNLEDQGRKSRLLFFKEIVDQERLGGVFLAHHADDQAETVLKRLFEGASLPKLRGLLPRMEMNHLMIYRPFLKVRKGEILNWLEMKGLSYFMDSTNQDDRFLRGRLRVSIIPLLAEHFGKEMTLPLCRIGEAALELDEFIEEQLEVYKQRICPLENGISLVFSSDLPQSRFLLKMAIRHLFDTQQVAISHLVLEALVNHLQKGSCHKVFKIGQKEVRIHRNTLSIQGNSLWVDQE